METEDLIELKRLVHDCMVPAVEVYFHDTVWIWLNEMERILEKFIVTYHVYENVFRSIWGSNNTD